MEILIGFISLRYEACCPCLEQRKLDNHYDRIGEISHYVASFGIGNEHGSNVVDIPRANITGPPLKDQKQRCYSPPIRS